MTGDVFQYVTTCVECQSSSRVPNIRISLCTPLTGLFRSFSIDLTGTLPPRPNEDRFLLISIKHLTSWKVICKTNNIPPAVLGREPAHLLPIRVTEMIYSVNQATSGQRYSPTSLLRMDLGGSPWPIVSRYRMAGRREWRDGRINPVPEPSSTKTRHGCSTWLKSSCAPPLSHYSENFPLSSHVRLGFYSIVYG